MNARNQPVNLANFIALAVSLLALLLATINSYKHASNTQNLKVRQIQIVDANGIIRAAVTTEDNQPVIRLKDETGQDRLALLSDDHQTALLIYDAAGTVRLGASQFAHGGGGYALHGENSQGAAVLYLKQQGRLTFYDEEGGIIKNIKAEGEIDG